ncbi:ATPase component of ABC-type sugar transporter [Sphaerochaeta pleomorpha str. Grapes]|uniref:ATPase component of ABC-type sugar transporter n=1 Tax=Sphaerochaeta pleomorpha (strain ATCC BAA-1885 / DSM 22778 / Grapes) TaxID=158190 RepID=G8QWP3_SPHPG|nr:ABC transporter ATP-binding protein [Sphaerochaeta pleomorpha]AEV28337.1 ATPase component of ABC-type sugar transporter [Sphaerochaeta pleomorpha str. Grapes]
MPKIELKHVTKRFGKFVAVDDLNLTIDDRSFVTLLGPSGCGKTTTLRMIAGLETPTEGIITINDRVVFSSEDGIDISPDKRDVGFLFQNYALWPHMTVYKNIAFGLENLKWPKEKVQQRVTELLDMLKIGEFRERYPSELSGGQQQRVAIARTLATGPKVLFMDEPLSNLDAKLRMEMRTELKRLHRETDSTFVYVTHDQLEAMTLSNRVCLMKNGYMQQYDPPLEVYRRPANTFTADFVGSPPINLISGKVIDDKPVILLLPGDVKLAFIPSDTVQLEVGQEIVLGIRPEHVEITDSDAMAEGIILSSLPSGMETIVQLSLGESYLHSVIFGDLDFDVQKKVGISFSKGNFNLFDKKTTLNLGQGKLAKA